MSFVPALCVACWRVQPACLNEAVSGRLACPSCRGTLRIVPGCSYSDDAREHFVELSGVVSESQLTPADAGALARQVQPSSWAGDYSRLIDSLCQRMPGLVPAQIALGKNHVAQRRLMAMMKTILEALATANRGSAEYPIPGAARAAKSGTKG